jgi:hypothetical protein
MDTALIEKLIERWRSEALFRNMNGSPEKWSEANGIRWCADQLEAALRSSSASHDAKAHADSGGRHDPSP